MAQNVEQLDRRVMLSAALVGSQLSIDGTDGNDVIIVGLNKRFVNIVTVWENDVEIADYSASAFADIRIKSGGGDDKIWIDSALNPMAYPVVVEAGDGNDMITTGDGVDVIDCGEGNDKAYGNGGNDTIVGRGGRDSIWAGLGDDNLDGGLGNDRINGEDGKDRIEGGKGNDIISGGADNDNLSDISGYDSISGDAGNDSGQIYSAAIVAAGDGDDNFQALGAAELFGEGGHDQLNGTRCAGGAGDDVLSGTSGNDELHGGAGDDVIYAYGGNDSLVGEDGNDVLYGGSGEDKLSGGAGDDNLYGTEGYGDPNKNQAGHDTAFGDAGADWFETDYQWGRTDRNKYDRPVNSQNYLIGDSSYGDYTSGKFYAAASVDVSAGTLLFGSTNRLANGSALTISGGTLNGAGTITLNNNWTGLTVGGTQFGTPIAQTIQTKSLGVAGTLSSGAYDPTAKVFVPPAMTRKERLAIGPVVLKLPAGWNLGSVTPARDDVLWYQVYRNGATAPTPPGIHVAAGNTLPITVINSQIQVGTVLVTEGPTTLVINNTVKPFAAGTYVWDGTTFAASTESEATYPVPTLDGQTVQAKMSTPHLYDGVQDGAYRFLAVKRGTILISGDNSDVSEPKFSELNAPVLAIPVGTDVRIAGSSGIYHPSAEYDALPTGGPRKLRGILVQGGAIWLPVDGTAPYFSSGK